MLLVSGVVILGTTPRSPNRDNCSPSTKVTDAVTLSFEPGEARKIVEVTTEHANRVVLDFDADLLVRSLPLPGKEARISGNSCDGSAHGAFGGAGGMQLVWDDPPPVAPDDEDQPSWSQCRLIEDAAEVLQYEVIRPETEEVQIVRVQAAAFHTCSSAVPTVHVVEVESE